MRHCSTSETWAASDELRELRGDQRDDLLGPLAQWWQRDSRRADRESTRFLAQRTRRDERTQIFVGRGAHAED